MRVVGGVVLGIVLAVVAVVGLGLSALPGIVNPFGSEEVDRSQPTLLTSIQDISRYDAAVGSFQVVLDQERDVRFVPGFIAGERSLFVAAGTVDAYVDLSSLAEGDLEVSEDGRSVEIRLPEARLDRPNLDQDRTRLFSQERGIVDRVEDLLSAPDQQELYQEAEQRLAAAAQESDLTARAEANTREMLEGLLGALDLEVTVVLSDDDRQ